MIEYASIEDVKTRLPKCNGTCVTIGVFDGLHLGHRALVYRCVQEAQAYGLMPLILTFQDHPLAVLAPAYLPKSILKPERKAVILSELGCEAYVNIEFTREFAEMDPTDFCRLVLADACRAKMVVIGYDFTFGWQGKGNIETLKRCGKQLGFDVVVLDPVSCGDLRVKSTMVRETLHLGQVDVAAWMLGRPYEMSGEVVSGFGRGREIGFPTANLDVDPKYVVPANGVYAVKIHIAGDWRHYGAMLNIGIVPTFGIGKRTIEAHLLSFNGNLVGKTLTVYFVKRLRDERKFASVEDLVAQLKRDNIATREALGQTQVN